MTCIYFFFQAEDGIRDGRVTGVQTCALPIYRSRRNSSYSDLRLFTGMLTLTIVTVVATLAQADTFRVGTAKADIKIGRASCRERVEIPGGGGRVKRNTRSISVAVMARLLA